MNCRRADRLMSDSLRAEISPEDAKQLELHLQTCRQCRDEYETDQATLQRVERVLHRPSDDLVTETMSAVRAAAEKRDRSSRVGRSTGQGRWSLGRAASVAAAVLVAAVAIAAWFLHSWEPSQDLPREDPRLVAGAATEPAPSRRPHATAPDVPEGDPGPGPALVADDRPSDHVQSPRAADRPSSRPEAYGTVASISGKADLKREHSAEWRAPTRGDALRPGDVLRTGADGGLLAEFGDGSSIDMAAETELVLGRRASRADRPSRTKLMLGDIRAAVKPGGGSFEVWTPAATAQVLGTEFILSAGEHATVLAVLDGAVVFRNDTGQVTARKMERTIAGIGHAPTEPHALADLQGARDWRQYAAGEMWRLTGAGHPATDMGPAAEAGSEGPIERPDIPSRTDERVAQTTDASPDVKDAADTDRTDPVAVAQAFVEACRSGDVDKAVSLLSPDDPFTLQLPGVVAALSGEGAGWGAPGLSQVLAEAAFLPMALELEAETPVVDLPGDGTAHVTVDRTWGVDQQLVMEQAEDGTWSIRPMESIRATTSSDTTFVEMQVSRASGPGVDDPYVVINESEKRLRALARGFEEYAQEHGNRLPPAAMWVDAVEPYVLDRQAFRCPAAPEQEYGYAMNVRAGELPLPPGFDQRRKQLILFEWRGGGRNASATPEELANAESFYPDGTIIVAHAGVGTRHLARGAPVDDALADDERRGVCLSHLSALEQASRRFALDNDGMLPGPGTWQDDIALYLLDETGADGVFTCPAAKGIDYAYAMNSEVAGRNARDLTGHDQIVLFFESDLNVPNATGDPDRDGATPARHGVGRQGDRMNHVKYLNGMTGYRPAPTEEE